MYRVKTKYFWVVMLCGLVINLVNAQAQLVSNKQITKTIPEFPESITRAEIININIIPLFGNRAKSLTQKAADESFLKNCDESFKDRSEACRFFCERGWEYLAEGELDTAMYRFNLAYMLNCHCSDTFWGMGVVCFQQNKVGEAIKLLNMGLDEDPKNAALLADLATLHINLYKQNKSEGDLKRALQLLNNSAEKDPANATTQLRFALAEFERGDFEKSWVHVHKCRTLDMDSLDLEFLKNLQAKMPDPMGVFR